MTQTKTGGGFFGDQAIPKEYVKPVVQAVRRDLPKNVKLIMDIGSAGYKPASHDIDLFIDADELIKHFRASDERSARLALQEFMQGKGYNTKLAGRNVHIEVQYTATTGPHTVQVDLMVIKDANLVAQWHQHGPRGMYLQRDFNASHNFILMSSIAKHLGMKFDAFAAKLIDRDTDVVIARTRNDVAKVLLNPNAKADDLNSVATMLSALENDPDEDAKLAQAMQDAHKGLIVMPERNYA